MPRINVDEEVFRDPRWFGLLSLVEKPEEAIGMLVMFWFLGQKYWQNGEQLIPVNRIPEVLVPVVRAGFGEERPDGVYVCGSRERFQWLIERREAGRKGGLAKAKQTLANAKQNVANLPSSSSSSSSSSLTPTLNVTNKSQKNMLGAEKPQLQADGSWSGINGKLSVWKETFPAVDIESELKRISAWVMANPKNRKKNWERFIVNWLSRTQDRKNGPYFGIRDAGSDWKTKFMEGQK